MFSVGSCSSSSTPQLQALVVGVRRARHGEDGDLAQACRQRIGGPRGQFFTAVREAAGTWDGSEPIRRLV